MAHHPLFVGVGDGSPFQFGHRAQGFLDGSLHFGVKIIRKGNSADVQTQPDGGTIKIMTLEAGPKNRWGCNHRSPDARNWIRPAKE